MSYNGLGRELLHMSPFAELKSNNTPGKKPNRTPPLVKGISLIEELKVSWVIMNALYPSVGSLVLRVQFGSDTCVGTGTLKQNSNKNRLGE